ncbi:MAG: extensin family protein [Pseudomonadota bacterium]
MRRAALALAAVLTSACVSSSSSEPDIPYADAPGSEYAPLRSPWPSPRGVAPTPVEISGGPVCGDRRIIGKRIATIEGPGACGVAAPVRVTSVAGVALTAPIRIGCEAAIALAEWTEDSAIPAASGASLASMRPVASYACRNRNHQRGARLSEHAKGNAVDIASFTFSDGRSISVLEGWRGEGRDYLRRVHREACGTFGTVLGPDSDRYHKDHFHLDVARHGNGPYCR